MAVSANRLELLQIADAVAREKSIDRQIVLASMEDAMGGLADVTWGRGYDKVIMTMGVGDAESVGKAFWLGGKRAKIIITNLHPTSEMNIQVPAVCAWAVKTKAKAPSTRARPLFNEEVVLSEFIHTDYCQ